MIRSMTACRKLFVRGTLLVLFGVVALFGPAFAASPADALYIGGTSPEPPRFTEGALDFGDAQAFHFRSDLRSLTIPYKTISKVEFTSRRGPVPASSTASHIKTLGFKSLAKLKKRNYMTVYFEKPGEAAEVALFELSPAAAMTAPPAMEARIQGKEPKPKSAYNDEDWWGNRYWRTNRNAHLWEEPDRSAGQTATQSRP